MVHVSPIDRHCTAHSNLDRVDVNITDPLTGTLSSKNDKCKGWHSRKLSLLLLSTKTNIHTSEKMNQMIVSDNIPIELGIFNVLI